LFVQRKKLREPVVALHIALEEFLIARTKRQPEPILRPENLTSFFIDELRDVRAAGGYVRADGRQQERERRQTLLTVDNVGVGKRFRLDQDDAAEKVRRHLFDLAGAVFHEAHQVVEKIPRLLGGPSIGTLIARNPKDVVVAENA